MGDKVNKFGPPDFGVKTRNISVKDTAGDWHDFDHVVGVFPEGNGMLRITCSDSAEPHWFGIGGWITYEEIDE